MMVTVMGTDTVTLLVLGMVGDPEQVKVPVMDN